jgi:glutamate 5-kinase
MQLEYKRKLLPRVRRIVVKLGSSVVATTSGVDRDNVGRLVAEIARVHADGYQVIVVTSGARAAGLARLGLSRMPTSIPEQQAAAAIGQISLMALYERFFADFSQHVGQVLLTASDIESRARYLNARHTLDHLLAHEIVPIVNENDSVAVEELKLGDNDRLSALVAGLVGAELLVLLTDVDGVYSDDPRKPGAHVLEVVTNVDELARTVGKPGALGTGGMASKLVASGVAAHRGIATVIAGGRTPGALAAVLDPARSIGTLVPASDTPISHRKYWIAYGMPVRGAVVMDAGAVQALSRRGGSLLPSGITEVRGRFEAGECVGCVAPDGREFARGLVAYDASDCERIRGVASARIKDILGYHMGDEIIHRDDLVLLADLGEERTRS